MVCIEEYDAQSKSSAAHVGGEGGGGGKLRLFP